MRNPPIPRQCRIDRSSATRATPTRSATAPYGASREQPSSGSSRGTKMPSSTAPVKPNAETLGDETFMSADDLRKYMTDMAMAKASKELSAMDKADEARKELMRTLQEKVELTPKRIAEIRSNLAVKLRAAAQRG